MSSSNSGKMVIATPSVSPITQIVQLIARLVRDGRLDDVKKMLTSIENKLHQGLGGVVKLEPGQMNHLEVKLQKSEKECNDLKAKNAKLMDTVNEYEKIVGELKLQVSGSDKSLEMYQEKIKVFDQKLKKLNLEAYDLWEKRAETQKVLEQMRMKLCEAQKNDQMLRHKLFESDRVMKQVCRGSFETKAALERMKRKMPEPDQGSEELKRQNLEARSLVEILSRRNLEGNIALKKLKVEKLEADKVLDLHKKWFSGLLPFIRNVGKDVGIFLNNSGATGSRGGGDEF